MCVQYGVIGSYGIVRHAISKTLQSRANILLWFLWKKDGNYVKGSAIRVTGNCLAKKVGRIGGGRLTIL